MERFTEFRAVSLTLRAGLDMFPPQPNKHRMHEILGRFLLFDTVFRSSNSRKKD